MFLFASLVTAVMSLCKGLELFIIIFTFDAFMLRARDKYKYLELLVFSL